MWSGLLWCDWQGEVQLESLLFKEVLKLSEKRFTFEYDDGQWGVPLFYDDGKKLCFDDVVDLLNEQQSTINELKERNAHNFAKKIALMKENEQLKQEIKAYPVNEEYAEEIMQQNQKLLIERNHLRKENEQLRKQLYEMFDLFNASGLDYHISDELEEILDE